MGKVAGIFAVAAVLLASSRIALAEPKTWEYAGGGQWPQVASAVTSSQPTAVSDPILDRVEEMIRAGQTRAAEKLAVPWLKSHKSDAQFDRGLRLMAQALYQYGDRIRAYYYLDELMDERPDSRFYGPALEMQYRIADGYLNGYKRRFLGLPAFHAYDEAIEMLYRVQQRSPGSQLAEKALLRTANYYYNDQQYDFAADTYVWK